MMMGLCMCVVLGLTMLLFSRTIFSILVTIITCNVTLFL